MDEAIAEALASEPDELTPVDVARIRGWNRVRAWRWLRSLHDRYDGEIVRRETEGREQYVIRKRDFAALLATRHPVDPRVLRRLLDFAEQIREHDRRLDVHAKALAKIHLL